MSDERVIVDGGRKEKKKNLKNLYLFSHLPSNTKQLASSTKTPEDYLAGAPASARPRPEQAQLPHPRRAPPGLRGQDRCRRSTRRGTASTLPPQHRRGDAGAWRACLDNARAQLEHQGNRSSTSSSRCGSGRGPPRRTRRTPLPPRRCLKSEAKEALSRVEGINRRRKLEQERAAEEAREHEERWVRGVRKCAEIEAACARLEEEVAALAAEAGGALRTKRQEEGNGGGEKGDYGKKTGNKSSDNNFGLPALPGGENGEGEEEARRVGE